MNSDRRLLFGAVPAAALAGGLSVALLFGGNASRPVTAQTTVALTAEQRGAATALEGAFMRVADTVGPATVRIYARGADPTAGSGPRGGGGEDDEDSFPFGQFFGPGAPGGTQRIPMTPPPKTASGSGAIIRPEGWIITNDHVIEEAGGGTVKVILSDNTEYPGKVFRDPSSDLALVKIDAGKPLPFVKIADSSRLRVGQWAIAIGSPFAQQNTMTTGIVSALHRSRPISDGISARYYSDLVQTDAAINPGNSGGPLLNIDGELIGVNVAILSRTGGSNGVGFAIPANTARIVADQLIAKGKVTRSSLGIVPRDIPAFLRTRVGTARGAYIEQVAPDTPADKAGLQPGDVITRFGGNEIPDEVTLRNAIALATPGTAVPITALREGKPVSVTATLVARDDRGGNGAETPSGGEGGDRRRPAPPARRPANELGINARSLTAEGITELRLPAGTRGVYVNGVLEGSASADAGLTPRTIITAVNGKPVSSVDELNNAMRGAKSGDIYTLTTLVPSAARDEKPFRGVVNIQVP